MLAVAIAVAAIPTGDGRAAAPVTTSFTDPDGSTWEHFPMTPRAAEAPANGEVVFDAEPVGLRT
jgi:hypothetical protein